MRGDTALETEPSERKRDRNLVTEKNLSLLDNRETKQKLYTFQLSPKFPLLLKSVCTEFLSLVLKGYITDI